jgi:hypothetical protein
MRQRSVRYGQRIRYGLLLRFNHHVLMTLFAKRHPRVPF